MKRSYTEEEVSDLIRNVIVEAANGIRDWIVKDTVIIDQITLKPIKNATIGLKKRRKSVAFRVYTRLRNIGIDIKEK